MSRVLVVEDEPGLVMALTQRLNSEGYEIEAARDGERGLALGLSEPFDVIVLDLMLPRKNGFDVCRDLRQKGISTPIIMLTARGQVVDKVVGLKLGADDYLTKPFAMMELLARIEALLRRSTNVGIEKGLWVGRCLSVWSGSSRFAADISHSEQQTVERVGSRVQVASLLDRALGRDRLAERVAE